MGTRSLIGVENDDGTISNVYCHWDGYVDGVGRTLLIKWCSRESVDALLSLGDLSSQGDDLLATEAFHRDKGEDLRPPSLAFDREQFLSDASHSGAQYCYLIDRGGVWWYSAGSAGFDPLLPAVKALEEKKARYQNV